MFNVQTGTNAVLTDRNGNRREFVTRKNLSFLSGERVKSDKGYLAFLRDGYILTVYINKVRIDRDIIEAIHNGLRRLAGVCNGALTEDGQGFNKVDTDFGKSMAMSAFLSTKMALAGARLVNKYRRQLDEDSVRFAQDLMKCSKAPEHDEDQCPDEERCSSDGCRDEATTTFRGERLCDNHYEGYCEGLEYEATVEQCHR